MKLKDYKKSVSEMTTEELMLHVKEVRKKRRTVIEPSKTTSLKGTGTKRKKKVTVDKASAAINNLSPEERAELIKQITGGLS